MVPAQSSIRFSIVISTYNRAALLPAAINSVRAQSFSNWELVIVDDGSTDNTETLLTELSNDSRIRIIRLAENQGASVARNMGVKETRGEFILVWDSDDSLYPNALEALQAAINVHPDAGIVSAQATPIKDGMVASADIAPEGYITLTQVLCKYLGNNEKVRAARRELMLNAPYVARNLDFMVNVYLANQASWYHIDESLGELRIAGADSLTQSRKKRNPVIAASRAPHLDAFLKQFGPLLKFHCSKRYAAYAYGAATASMAASNMQAARMWSRESILYALTLRHLAAFVWIRFARERGKQ